MSNHENLMAVSREIEENRIKYGTRLGLIPNEVINRNDGLSQADAFLKSGGCVIGVTTHIDKLDIPVLLGFIGRETEVLRKTRILIPIAYHQYNAFLLGGVIQWLSKKTQIEFAPIVTKLNSKIKQAGKKIGDGRDHYMERVEDYIKNGGVIIYAPQKERSAHLGKPKGKSLVRLFEKADRAETDNVAVLYLGLALSGNREYGRRFNLHRKHQVILGPFEKMNEVRQHAKESGRTIDEHVYDHFAKLMPLSYLGNRNHKAA